MIRCPTLRTILFSACLSVAGSAYAAEPESCGGGIKRENIAGKSERDLVREIYKDKRSTLDDGKGQVLTTARLSRYRTGMLGTGVTKSGTFEYFLDYEAGRYLVVVRSFYGPLAPGAIAFDVDGAPLVLRPVSMNAVEVDKASEPASSVNGYGMILHSDTFHVSRFSISSSDVDRLARRGGGGPVSSSRDVAKFGQRTCPLTLFPREFEALRKAIADATPKR